MTLPFSMATYAIAKRMPVRTHTTGEVWVCRCLCAIDRVSATDACANPTMMVMDITSSTPVRRVRGFHGYRPSGAAMMVWLGRVQPS